MVKATSVSVRLRSNSFRLRGANTDKAPEESLKKNIEVDRLIDMVSQTKFSSCVACSKCAEPN